MTREEIKIAALRDREIKIAASNYVEENSVNGYEAISSHIDSFIEGADWTDKHPINVWHDASEKPRANEWLLIQFGEDDYDALSLNDLYIDMWCDWCKTSNVSRWAYISDLLPKGGEK